MDCSTLPFQTRTENLVYPQPTGPWLGHSYGPDSSLPKAPFMSSLFRKVLVWSQVPALPPVAGWLLRQSKAQFRAARGWWTALMRTEEPHRPEL